jgi:hypothetical protein
MLRASLVVFVLGCSSNQEAPNTTVAQPVKPCDTIGQCTSSEACLVYNGRTPGACIPKCTFTAIGSRTSPECPKGTVCIGIEGTTVNAFCYRFCTDVSECAPAPAKMKASCEIVQDSKVCNYTAT